jgi:hypothetical protein
MHWTVVQMLHQGSPELTDHFEEPVPAIREDAETAVEARA